MFVLSDYETIIGVLPPCLQMTVQESRSKAAAVADFVSSFLFVKCVTTGVC